jgi:hypothetical protein
MEYSPSASVLSSLTAVYNVPQAYSFFSSFVGRSFIILSFYDTTQDDKQPDNLKQGHKITIKTATCLTYLKSKVKKISAEAFFGAPYTHSTVANTLRLFLQVLFWVCCM